MSSTQVSEVVEVVVVRGGTSSRGDTQFLRPLPRLHTEAVHSKRAHKERVQLKGLNGSGASGHGGSARLNGPHCVAAVTGGSHNSLVF